MREINKEERQRHIERIDHQWLAKMIVTYLLIGQGRLESDEKKTQGLCRPLKTPFIISHEKEGFSHSRG